MRSITNDILINMSSISLCVCWLCASLADFMTFTQTDKRFRVARHSGRYLLVIVVASQLFEFCQN